MTHPTLDRVSIHRDAVTYLLRFKPYGWAIVTVDDATGTLNVASDWGNYVHTWGRGSWLGVESNDLSEFLRGRGGPHYIVDKLFYGRQRSSFDDRATMLALRREVLADRRARQLTAGTARSRWDALGELDGMVESEAMEVLERLYRDSPWEHAVHSPTGQYTAMLEIVIPAFLSVIRNEVPTREAASG